MSFRSSQLKSFHVHHGVHSSDNYGGYVSDSMLVTRRHRKSHRSHVTFSEDINEISDVNEASRRCRTENIDDVAEEFIRLKHNQMCMDSN